MTIALEPVVAELDNAIAAFLNDGWTTDVVQQMHGVARSALNRHGFASTGRPSIRSSRPSPDGCVMEVDTSLVDPWEMRDVCLRSRFTVTTMPRAFGGMCLDWQLATPGGGTVTVSALRVDALHDEPPAGKEARTLKRQLGRAVEAQVRGSHITRAADFADRGRLAWARALTP